MVMQMPTKLIRQQMTMGRPEDAGPTGHANRRVQVWLNDGPPLEFTADETEATNFAEDAVRHGIVVRVDDEDTQGLPQLPCHRLWRPDR